ncbi:tyrosine-type recombinase/integrase, partial [Pontimicrobium sp. MEBiC01747]
FKRLSNRKRIVGKDTVTTGIKPSTIKTYYNKLIAFFRWLETKEDLPKNFCKQLTRPSNPTYDDSRALTDNEVSRILSSITLNNIDNHFLYTRDLIIAELLLYTGIRSGELLALKIGDIDFVQKNIFINGKTSKSKKSRYIPLHFTLASHLKSFLKERERLKFTCDSLIISTKSDTPLSKYGLKHWVRKYTKLSGVKFHLHRFRHTFACKLALENADIMSIMNILGHVSIKTTQIYLRSIKTETSRTYIQQINY